MNWPATLNILPGKLASKRWIDRLSVCSWSLHEHSSSSWRAADRVAWLNGQVCSSCRPEVISQHAAYSAFLATRRNGAQHLWLFIEPAIQGEDSVGCIVSGGT